MEPNSMLRRARTCIVAVLLAFGFAPPGFALGGTWTTAASMGTPRSHSAATLLRSGKVLVSGGLECCIGGYGNSNTLPKVFDPATNSWSDAGTTWLMRTDHSATLLHSGKVLLVGGWSGYATLATALLYDPVANSWSPAASLHAPRYGHTATLLPSGKVLVAGGVGADYTNINSGAEIYDPDSDSWSVATSMSNARMYHTATLLNSGKILVAGGQTGGVPYASVEVYDPATDTWSNAASLPVPTYSHASALLSSGKIAVIGGFNQQGFLTTTQIYDPANNIWKQTSGLSNARAFHSASLLPSGQVLVVGGESVVVSGNSSTGVNLNSTEIYDPVLDAWTAGPQLNIERQQHFATVLQSGTVFVSGGANSTNEGPANAEMLDTGSPAIFTSLSPARLLDTRAGSATIDGLFSGSGQLSGGSRLDLRVSNRAGVPATGVSAVALNVTVVMPTRAGYMTIWPADSTRPNASNLNFIPGDVRTNMVVAKVSADGKVALYNSAGATDIIVDVVGWFPATSGLTPLVPARLLDTRAGFTTIDSQFAGMGAVQGSAQLDLTISGRGAIPFGALGSALLNTTVTNPTAPGYITVWPQGLSRPLASNVNFVAGQTLPNLVLARASGSGSVSIFNSAGSTDLIADVVGWFPAASELNPVSPARILDTRSGASTNDGAFAGTGALIAQSTRDLQVSGRAGIPSDNVGAVVMNVTITNPTAAGYLTVWPSGAALPNASNINFVPAQTVPNLVIAKLGAGGKISMFNSAGSTEVIADVVGWFPAQP